METPKLLQKSWLSRFIAKINKQTIQELKDTVEATELINDVLENDTSVEAEKVKMQHFIAKDALSKRLK